jgi:DNA-binding IscR family transcriptional regulator
MKQLKKELLVVARDFKKLSQKIDRMAKRVAKIEKSQKPKKTKTVELSEFLEIDPAILARVIRGKIYPSDIVLGFIIANPDGIEMATLEKKTGLKYDTIRQIILKLRNQGKIKSKRKEGLRGKAYAAGKRRFLYFEA